MPLDLFHPAVRIWFERRFPDGPSAPQVRGWPAIRSGRHTLIAAPTGSGKTLAAFLSAIDELVRQGLGEAAGHPAGSLAVARGLPDETRVVYVSPLKALSNDVRRNLEEPLEGIRAEIARLGLGDIEIRTAVRTGDTSPSERQAMVRRPPHILVTTPESLFILLTTVRGREMLETVRTVIVDEIHAVADDKRGSHLVLTLERLEHLALHGAGADRAAARAPDSPYSPDPSESSGLPLSGRDGNGDDAGPAARDLPSPGNGRVVRDRAQRPLLDAEPYRSRHAGQPPVRIGLSATQQPIEEVARFLVGTRRAGWSTAAHAARAEGAGDLPAEGTGGSLPDGAAGAPDCVIVDEGHLRSMELALEVPGSPLSAIMSGEVWDEIHDRLAELILENRTTLVFVNTRRLAERTAHHLSKRLGEDLITSHHGSLSRARRLDAEERLKRGELRALVATASLELGIDIGTVDLVCQIGSPHTIAALLQRVGRSGRLRGATARGRLFALSRDELVECAALLLSAREGLLDRLVIPERPLDILAQQIVAAAATRDWEETELFELMRGAYPFRRLSREDYDAVVRMLADGYATRRGRRSAWIHHDRVNGRIRARRGARLAAVSAGGAIPDVSDFLVVLLPEGTPIGTLNEDFAIESMQGDVFQLGNSSWRILRVESGRVLVEDAHGQPPSIPFWLGEAPARTAELSAQVSRVRAEVERRLMRRDTPVSAGNDGDAHTNEARAHGDGADTQATAADPPETGPGAATRWLVQTVGLPPAAAEQLEEYLDAARKVLTVVPTQETLVLERFFDEAGGMQLVVHSPFGGRINRAWGLALRKRFCRSFNFELQAAANEDAIVLSLGPQHSFPLIDVFDYLRTASARDLLVQALLAAPMFGTRWRWNAGRALGILRQQNGRRVPPQILRMRSEDLLAAAFPQAAACLEHIVGDIQVPNHPIVRQTVEDCLVEAMDIEGLEALLGRIERGELRLVGRDVPEPSPLAHEILNARPYAFLDDAPAEERRTLAVATRRDFDYREADDLGTLDAEAIERVRSEAWPDPEGPDETHDALLWMSVLTEGEAESWKASLESLRAERRAARVTVGACDEALTASAAPVRKGPFPTRTFWVAAERLPLFEAVYGDPTLDAPIRPPEGCEAPDDRGQALVELLRGRVEAVGPVVAADLAELLGVRVAEVDAALVALESEGLVLRGHFTPPPDGHRTAAGPPSTGGRGPGTHGERPLEWCHRRLLARVHRYTVDRLRAEIEPAAPAELMRFLFAWQHVDSERRLDGPRGLLEVVRQLQGCECPAAAWEREIFPSRLNAYDPAWLDQLCLSGAVTWGRLVPPAADAAAAPNSETSQAPRPRSGMVRSSPLAFLLRDEAEEWLRCAAAPAVGADGLSHAAWEVLSWLRRRGASFGQDLAGRTGLPAWEVERGLAELVSWGLVTADGVAGLRALLRPARDARRPRPYRRRPHRAAAAHSAGRWSLLRELEPGRGVTVLEAPNRTDALNRNDALARTDALARADAPAPARARGASRRGGPAPDTQAVLRREATAEMLTRQVLARYGVVVRRVLERESLLPPWREMVRVLRRLEMRGEIRGGRFLQGASGEQFALPEAVELLRSVRRSTPGGEVVVVNGGDPLNLTGVVTPGERIPGMLHNRVAYRDGVPVAARLGAETVFMRDPESASERERIRSLVNRSPASRPGSRVAEAFDLFHAS